MYKIILKKIKLVAIYFVTHDMKYMKLIAVLVLLLFIGVAFIIAGVNAMTEDTAITNQQNYNHLKNEKSPYLLQHAQNPVDWYPWGAEAFEKARAQDKPIFLSIGYSTCHWCHVMEHESFEDSDVAARMNDLFVSIKVDREERPDIDNIYMSVCQMLNRRRGLAADHYYDSRSETLLCRNLYPQTQSWPDGWGCWI